MDPKLLDLTLGVKIPVTPGSKPVFSRGKLGEKVKAEERGRRALLFYGVPVIPRSPRGHLLYSGSCSPSVGRGWGLEGSSWLPGAQRKENVPRAAAFRSISAQLLAGAALGAALWPRSKQPPVLLQHQQIGTRQSAWAQAFFSAGESLK